ncbi:hypothetical protein AB0D38_16760 [Streptomyces sp. NPDC048279]|uniref:hypothetical protein n=1 Tax=Streptomyces sp. NPDC048279 TaxID=3154714 RepID=UPI00342D44F6
MGIRRLTGQLVGLRVTEYLEQDPVGLFPRPRLYPPVAEGESRALADRAGQPLEAGYGKFLSLTDGMDSFHLTMPLLGCRDWTEGGRAAAALRFPEGRRDADTPVDVGLPEDVELFAVSVDGDLSQGVFTLDRPDVCPERWWWVGEGSSSFFSTFADVLAYAIDPLSYSPPTVRVPFFRSPVSSTTSTARSARFEGLAPTDAARWVLEPNATTPGNGRRSGNSLAMSSGGGGTVGLMITSRSRMMVRLESIDTAGAPLIRLLGAAVNEVWLVGRPLMTVGARLRSRRLPYSVAVQQHRWPLRAIRRQPFRGVMVHYVASVGSVARMGSHVVARPPQGTAGRTGVLGLGQAGTVDGV